MPFYGWKLSTYDINWGLLKYVDIQQYKVTEWLF